MNLILLKINKQASRTSGLVNFWDINTKILSQNRKQSTYYRFSLKNQTHLKLLLYITRNHMLLSMFEVNKKDQDHTLKNIPNLSENTSQLNLI